MLDKFLESRNFIVKCKKKVSHTSILLKIDAIFDIQLMGPRERSVGPLRRSEDDPKTILNQHQSLSGEILPNFDINNLSVAQKLQKLELGPFHLEL